MYAHGREGSADRSHARRFSGYPDGFYATNVRSPRPPHWAFEVPTVPTSLRMESPRRVAVSPMSYPPMFFLPHDDVVLAPTMTAHPWDGYMVGEPPSSSRRGRSGGSPREDDRGRSGGSPRECDYHSSQSPAPRAAKPLKSHKSRPWGSHFQQKGGDSGPRASSVPPGQGPRAESAEMEIPTPRTPARPQVSSGRSGDSSDSRSRAFDAVVQGCRDGQNQLQQLVGRLAATLDRSRSAENSNSEVHYASPRHSDVESACAQKSEPSGEDADVVGDISRRRARQVSLKSNNSTGDKLQGFLEERRREVQDKYNDHHSGAARVAWCCEVATCVVFFLAWLLLLVLSFVTTSAASFVTTWFVSGIAAMTYYAKSCHMGDAVILGHVVPIARYIDWVTTTPLMLYELCHIAHASTAQTMWVVGCDVAMLVTGIIAALIPWNPHKGKKHVWFAISCVYYVLMVAALQVDVAKKAKKQTEQVQELFLQLEVLTVAVWSCYPIVCGLGRAHLGVITRPVEDILLCILDVLAKIGMEGFIVLSCINGGCTSEASH